MREITSNIQQQPLLLPVYDGLSMAQWSCQVIISTNWIITLDHDLLYPNSLPQSYQTIHLPSDRHVLKTTTWSTLVYPLPSMYGILFAYIWLIFMVNVGKYTIHGWYGYWWYDFLKPTDAICMAKLHQIWSWDRETSVDVSMILLM